MRISKNSPVRFYVSEPEDFFFDNGEGPFDGVFIGYSKGVAFIKVISPVMKSDRAVSYLAAVARHEGEAVTQVHPESPIIVNFVPLFANELEGDFSLNNLLDSAQQYRGPHMIGEIQATGVARDKT